MKTISLKWLSFLAAVVIGAGAFSGCAEEESDRAKGTPGFQIEGDHMSLQVGEAGNASSPAKYTIRTDKKWKFQAAEDYDWARVYPNEGTNDGIMKIYVQKSNVFQERTATFNIYLNGSVEPTPFVVTQEAATPLMNVKNLVDGVFTVSREAHEPATIEIETNLEWSYSVAPKVSGGDISWLTFVEKTDKGLKFNVAYNPNDNLTRSALITIATPSHPALGLTFEFMQNRDLSVEGFPAKGKVWGVSGGGFMDSYKDQFDASNNKIFANLDDGTNANTDAYISYIQRDDTSNDTDSRFTRVVGGTGQPYVTGGWPGDYWYFNVPVKKFPAGGRVKISFITRVSGTGHKFWILEYKDGNEWKPGAPTMQKTIGSQDFTYTHEMNSNGSTNISVDAVMPITDAIDDGAVEIRFRVAANAQASNESELAKPNGGTARIASNTDGANSPVIEFI